MSGGFKGESEIVGLCFGDWFYFVGRYGFGHVVFPAVEVKGENWFQGWEFVQSYGWAFYLEIFVGDCWQFKDSAGLLVDKVFELSLVFAESLANVGEVDEGAWGGGGQDVEVDVPLLEGWKEYVDYIVVVGLGKTILGVYLHIFL